MELTGEHRIAAPRRVVWDALHDPSILKDCIKGCKRLEMTAPDAMVATVEAKVGPVKATFDATVAIENSVPPESYRLSGEGKGGVAGFAKGFADVSLAEDGPDATIMRFSADAKVGGKLAQLGQRLVDSTARKYASDFFDAFSARLNAGAPTTAALPGTDADAVPEPAYGEAPVLANPMPARPDELLPSRAAPEPSHAAAAAEAAFTAATPAMPTGPTPRIPAAPAAAAFIAASPAMPPGPTPRIPAAATPPIAPTPPDTAAGGGPSILLVVVVIAAIAAGAIYFLS